MSAAFSLDDFELPPSKPLLERTKETPPIKSKQSEQFQANPRQTGLLADLILFSKLLRVPEGAFMGTPFVLRPWQLEILSELENPHLRRLIISFGRKNGKTALVAFLVLAALCGPLVQRNGTVYSAARSREQASLVFKLACGMIRQSPFLASKIKINNTRKELVCHATGVTYRALSAEATTAMGLSPFLVIHDELGQVVGLTDPLYDALETAGGAQAQFLTIVVSTQAPTDQALLSQLIDDCLANPDDDRSKLVLYTSPGDQDPYSLEAWKAANPALGDFRSLTDVIDQAERAKRLPSAEASFLNLTLNRRISATNAFLTPAVWGKCAGSINQELFYREPVFGGLDLSQTTALTAAVFTVRDPDTDIHHLWPHFFMPAETILERSEQDRVPYKAWADKGLIELVPGKVVDFDWVALRLLQLTKRMHVAEIRYDRWRIEEFKAAALRQNASWSLVPHGQGYASMSPSLERFETIVVNEKLRHGANPVMTFCMSNVIVIRDPAGNRKLDRRNTTTARIDGAVAAVMATAVVDAETMEGGRTIYSTKARPTGILSLSLREASGNEGRKDRQPRDEAEPQAERISFNHDDDPFRGLED